MVKPVFLAVFIFRHDADGLTLLDYIATYDANGPCILGCSFYIPCFVLCFFNEFLPLFLDRFSLVIVLRFSILNPLHSKTFLPSAYHLSPFPKLFMVEYFLFCK